MLQYKTEKLATIFDKVAHVQGAVIEFGVFHGHTLGMLATRAPHRDCYGFDTFKGFPAIMDRLTTGDPCGSPFDEVDVEKVKASMPANVTLRIGSFPESLQQDDFNLTVAFAHVDFDWYKPMRDALDFLLPRMAPGGIIAFDDWHKDSCPGVMRAIDDKRLIVIPYSKHQAYWQSSVQ